MPVTHEKKEALPVTTVTHEKPEAPAKPEASVDDLFKEIKVLGEEKEALDKKLSAAEKKVTDLSLQLAAANEKISQLEKAAAAPKPNLDGVRKALRDKVLVPWGNGLRCNQCGQVWESGSHEQHTAECLARP